MDVRRNLLLFSMISCKRYVGAFESCTSWVNIFRPGHRLILCSFNWLKKVELEIPRWFSQQFSVYLSTSWRHWITTSPVTPTQNQMSIEWSSIQLKAHRYRICGLYVKLIAPAVRTMIIIQNQWQRNHQIKMIDCTLSSPSGSRTIIPQQQQLMHHPCHPDWTQIPSPMSLQSEQIIIRSLLTENTTSGEFTPLHLSRWRMWMCN